MNKAQCTESQLAGFVNRLPLMPGNIDKVFYAQDHLEQENDLLDVIKHDPGLCADVLHIANSMFSQRVETIEQALHSVGLKPIIEQLVEIAHDEQSLRGQMVNSACLGEYYAHSQEIAFGCKLLAQAANMPAHQVDIYEVAGLIHDIGRLVTMLARDVNIIELMGSSIEQMQSILEDEQLLIGMDHCQVGAMVCQKWNLSATLIDGVLRHHDPVRPESSSKAAAVIFASHFLGLYGLMDVSAMMPQEILRCIGLDRTGFDLTAREFSDRLEPTAIIK